MDCYFGSGVPRPRLDRFIAQPGLGCELLGLSASTGLEDRQDLSGHSVQCRPWADQQAQAPRLWAGQIQHLTLGRAERILAGMTVRVAASVPHADVVIFATLSLSRASAASGARDSAAGGYKGGVAHTGDAEGLGGGCTVLRGGCTGGANSFLGGMWGDAKPDLVRKPQRWCENRNTKRAVRTNDAAAVRRLKTVYRFADAR